MNGKFCLKKTSPKETTLENDNRYSSYDSSRAVDYAMDYYEDYNPDYPDWGPEGGDCANFVSQCLYAGGQCMIGIPGTDEEAQDWDNWFSEGFKRNTKKVSSTWRGANAFKSYWKSNSSEYQRFYDVDKYSWRFGFKGDAISLLRNSGRAYHTLLIVGYEYPDFVLGAHSGETITTELSNIVPPGGFIIYHMR